MPRFLYIKVPYFFMCSQLFVGLLTGFRLGANQPYPAYKLTMHQISLWGAGGGHLGAEAGLCHDQRPLGRRQGTERAGWGSISIGLCSDLWAKCDT